jgi:hypothetical protein
MEKVWVYTKLGEQKWKESRLPKYRDDSHDEGKLVDESLYEYCKYWAKSGYVKLIEWER